MSRLQLSIGAFLLFATLAAIPSRAAVMKFEGVVASGGSQFPIPSYTEAGFSLTNGGIFSAESLANTNGTDVFGWCGYCAVPDPVVVELTAVDGNPFNFLALDGGNLDGFRITQRLQVLGYLDGGGTVSQEFTLSHAWQSFTLVGFHNLIRAQLIGLDVAPCCSLPEPAIDNLVLTHANAVSLPSSLYLLGFGLAGLGWSRRRKYCIGRKSYGRVAGTS